jgi:hypothetical protein
VRVLQQARKIEERVDTPVRDVVQRVGDEMRDLADGMHRIQSLVSLLVREDAFNEGRNVREMQSLDLIAQKLGCLAEFLANLGEDIPDFWRVDAHSAARVVVLSDLAARLTVSDPYADFAAALPGDFETF